MKRRTRVARCSVAATILALAGCPTVDLGDTPADIGSCRPDRTYFETTIWPSYIVQNMAANRSCIGAGSCHDAQNSPRSAMRFQTNPLDLSANYTVSTRFLNCGSPDASEMLTKPRMILSHPVEAITANSTEQQIFLDWFDQ